MKDLESRNEAAVILFLHSGVDAKYQELWQLTHATLYPLAQPVEWFGTTTTSATSPADLVKSHPYLTLEPGVHLAF